MATATTMTAVVVVEMMTGRCLYFVSVLTDWCQWRPICWRSNGIHHRHPSRLQCEYEFSLILICDSFLWLPLAGHQWYNRQHVGTTSSQLGFESVSRPTCRGHATLPISGGVFNESDFWHLSPGSLNWKWVSGGHFWEVDLQYNYVVDVRAKRAKFAYFIIVS